MYFFDLDGTLLDSTSIWSDIDVAFLSRRGISPVPPDYTDYVSHHSAPDAARYTKQRFGLRESPQEIMDEWEGMAQAAYSQTLELKPGVKDFLLAAKGEGQRMAVITSCFPHLCRAALEHHKIAHLFELVLTTMETGLEKRDGELYRMAARMCGVEPQECTLFEDNPGYCSAAREVGFRIVGIRDPMCADRQDKNGALCLHGRFLNDFTEIST